MNEDPLKSWFTMGLFTNCCGGKFSIRFNIPRLPIGLTWTCLWFPFTFRCLCRFRLLCLLWRNIFLCYNILLEYESVLRTKGIFFSHFCIVFKYNIKIGDCFSCPVFVIYTLISWIMLMLAGIIVTWFKFAQSKVQITKSKVMNHQYP